MSFGVLTFSQDTFSGVGTISARVTFGFLLTLVYNISNLLVEAKIIKKPNK